MSNRRNYVLAAVVIVLSGVAGFGGGYLGTYLNPSLRGPQGIQGPQGMPGPQGPTGPAAQLTNASVCIDVQPDSINVMTPSDIAFNNRFGTSVYYVKTVTFPTVCPYGDRHPVSP
jgi:hypothetical protein